MLIFDSDRQVHDPYIVFELAIVRNGLVYRQNVMRAFFIEILGSIGSVVLTIMSLIRLALYGYHEFKRVLGIQN